MIIDGSNCPYLSNFILTTIASKLCYGNIELRYGCKNLITDKKYKGLVGLVLAYYAAENNISHQFASFNQLKSAHLIVEKGSKTFHAPILQKNINGRSLTTKIEAACFFNADQVLGFKTEKKQDFNIPAFLNHYDLNSSDSSYLLDVVHLIESFCSDSHKHYSLIYNILAAYFSDILEIKIPQKNAQQFLGTLTLNDLRNITLVANEIIEIKTPDFQRTYCSKAQADLYLKELRVLMKS